MVLPSKLGREPLIEAIFELQFTAVVPASNIIPGALFGSIGGVKPKKVERLPISQLPEAMRKADPALRHSPLLAMDWNGFNLLIGDEAIAVACFLPYPRWRAFKEAITQIVGDVAKIGIVQSVERYSLKYVDLVPVASVESQVQALNWSVRVGSHQLSREIAAVRLEIPRDGLLHLINIQTGATVALKDGRTLEGLAVDVDTIAKVGTADIPDFVTRLPGLLETIHSANKSVFFECLTPETITSLEPTYE